MTPCEIYIKERLKEKRFFSIAEFMEIALYHSEFGYYMKQNPLGDQQDFVTSPEIGQLFGEVLCLWAMDKYLILEKPVSLAIVELGPGRGLMMADFLRFAQRFPEFHQSLDLHFIEVSPFLRKIQQNNIIHPAQKWHPSLEDAFKSIGTKPTLILANEFLDALPLEQFQKTKEGWQQRGIALDTENNLQFCFQNIDPSQLPLDLQSHPYEENKIIEYNALAEETVRLCLQHLQKTTGFGLFIDYGYVEGQGDTLQGMARHQYKSVLEKPGDIDLTSHIHFGRLQRQCGPQSTLMTQRDFLFKQGLLTLVQNYRRKSSTEIQQHLENQVYKLTSSQEMGTLFKVLEINLGTSEEPLNA